MRAVVVANMATTGLTGAAATGPTTGPQGARLRRQIRTHGSELATIALGCTPTRQLRRWSDTKSLGTTELSVIRDRRSRVGERVLAGTIWWLREIVNVAATDSVVLPDALSFEQVRSR